MFAAADADEYARSSAGYFTWRDSRVFQGFPCQFQQQALLRIDARSFAAGDSEKASIKEFHAVEEAAPTRIHFSQRARFRSVKRLGIPAIRRHLRHCVLSVAEELP